MPGVGPPDQDTLAVSDAARSLGVTAEYVRRQLRDGRLHGLRHGREWRVFAWSLEVARSRRAKSPHVDQSDGLDTAGTRVDVGGSLRSQLENAELLRDWAVTDAHEARLAQLRAEVAALRLERDELKREFAERVGELKLELADALAALQAITAQWARRRAPGP